MAVVTVLANLAELCTGIPEASEWRAETSAQEEETFCELSARSAEEDAALGSLVAAEAAGGFHTQRTQAVFWSGLGKDAETIAAKYAEDHGSITLEQTAGGRALTNYNPDDPSTVAAWGGGSGSFPRGASGIVRVVLGNSSPTSIWNTVELPDLHSNPAVSAMSAIDPGTGVPTLLWGRQ